MNANQYLKREQETGNDVSFQMAQYFESSVAEKIADFNASHNDVVMTCKYDQKYRTELIKWQRAQTKNDPCYYSLKTTPRLLIGRRGDKTACGASTATVITSTATVITSTATVITSAWF